MLNLPLMHNNITQEDRNAVIEFLKGDPILTHSTQVRLFEEEWSKWLGVRYSVFVNSGASANLLTLTALKFTEGLGEIIVPPLTWVSDIASVLQCGFTPVFCDISPMTLGMDTDAILAKITPRTKAVFLTHVLGFNALTTSLLHALKERNIPLIEDVSESHGALFDGKKLGTFGLLSNFSFYYAHHMSTIEGGMICTDDIKLYETIRMLRSHGMVREAWTLEIRDSFQKENPDLNPDFIFAYPAYNVRPTELNAVIGLAQLKRLDGNNEKRRLNFKLFLESLDPTLYRTEFAIEGSCNYAFTLILKEPNPSLSLKIQDALKLQNVEFRRGLSGGGNQLRQPYLRDVVPQDEHLKYPEVEHVHFYGFYIGNYPDLEKSTILQLCRLLNEVKG